MLAEEAWHGIQAYEAQHPKQEYTLRARDDSWFPLARGLPKALGLVEQSADKEAPEDEAPAADS